MCINVISSSGRFALPPLFGELEQRGVQFSFSEFSIVNASLIFATLYVTFCEYKELAVLLCLADMAKWWMLEIMNRFCCWSPQCGIENALLG